MRISWTFGPLSVSNSNFEEKPSARNRCGLGQSAHRPALAWTSNLTVEQRGLFSESGAYVRCLCIINGKTEHWANQIIKHKKRNRATMELLWILKLGESLMSPPPQPESLYKIFIKSENFKEKILGPKIWLESRASLTVGYQRWRLGQQFTSALSIFDLPVRGAWFLIFDF